MKTRMLQQERLRRPWRCALGLLGCAPKTLRSVTRKKRRRRSQGRIVRDVEFSGVLVPNHTVNIFAKLTGQATTVAVDVGDRVQAGQLSSRSTRRS